MIYTIDGKEIEARTPAEAVMRTFPDGPEHHVTVIRGERRVFKAVYLDGVWREFTGQLESVYSRLCASIISNGVDCVLARNARGVASFDNRTVQFGGIDGAADYYGVSYGRHVEVEIKTPKGVQARNQVTYQKLIEKHGGIYRVIRTPDEARAFVAWLRETNARGN